MTALAIIIATTVLIAIAAARDVAIRVLADRADARVKRVAASDERLAEIERKLNAVAAQSNAALAKRVRN